MKNSKTKTICFVLAVILAAAAVWFATQDRLPPSEPGTQLESAAPEALPEAEIQNAGF